MKITEILKNKDVLLSFEVFPPKNNAPFEPVKKAVEALSAFKPDFMSVTYGAGGGTSNNTIDIASYIQDDLNIMSLAHLSCASSSQNEIDRILKVLKSKKIDNILALRGDIPQDMSFPEAGYYKYAYQLVEEIKSTGDFCIGAACYPEGHVESPNKEKDIDNLKYKVDCGVDFLITQIYFDNNTLYNFLYRAMAKDITVPVFAGIMPVTDSNLIKRMCKLSGALLPQKFMTIVDKFGDNPQALKQAGIAYATEQIIDLVSNGIKGIHIYTMNKPEVAQKIKENLSEILK